MNRECSKEGGGSSLYCRYHPVVRLYAEAEEYKTEKKEVEDIVSPIISKLYQGAGGSAGGAGADEDDRDEL